MQPIAFHAVMPPPARFQDFLHEFYTVRVSKFFLVPQLIILQNLFLTLSGA